MEKILNAALAKITPTQKELLAEKKFCSELLEKIRSMKGRHVRCELVGSMARNTHLRNDNDIDVFVFFPESLPREEFEGEGLRIGKAVFRGHEWETAYSEHPYIRGRMGGFDVEIVPAYDIEDAARMKSAVDRSALHSRYLSGKLSEAHKKEVRLLKQFMKGVKCYGADLSSNSFPGYVAELLVLKYGGFKKTIEAASAWRKGEIVDVEKQLSDVEAKKKFDSHFIVVDPVDKNRNVAAALSLNQYARFVAACREFMKNPSINFFFPKKHKPWNASKLRGFLKKTELVAIKTGYPKGVVEDVMWGQLRRLSKKISTQAQLAGFTVKRHGEWLENKHSTIIILEVESTRLQKAKIETGPEAIDGANSIAFLKAHKKILSGPRIENGRWVLEVERKHTEIRKFLSMLLKKMEAQERDAMRNALSKASIMGEKDIIALYKKNYAFEQFLTGYLKGKEEFLDY